jgi:hypothetical protein
MTEGTDDKIIRPEGFQATTSSSSWTPSSTVSGEMEVEDQT